MAVQGKAESTRSRKQSMAEDYKSDRAVRKMEEALGVTRSKQGLNKGWAVGRQGLK